MRARRRALGFLAHAGLFLFGAPEQRGFLEGAGGVGLGLRGRRGGFGVGGRLQRARERRHERLGDLQVRAALVLPVHEVPRGEREVAALQEVVVEPVRLLVIAMVASLSSLTRHRVAGSSCRRVRRFFCASFVTCTKNFTTR